MILVPHTVRWLLFLILVLPAEFAVRQKAKSVTTLLHAKWEETPLVLEIAEFIGDESDYDFWTYVDLVSEYKPELVSLPTEKEQYEAAISLAGQVVSSLQLNVLKLTLSMRGYSAKVAMFNQMASERGLHESRCPAAIDFNERLYCDLSEFLEDFKKADGKGSYVAAYKTDHHYPRVGGSNASATVVLYGELGTSTLTEMHQALKQLVQTAQINYVLRHYVKQERPKKKVRLSGYGVELQMKSTEYKAMDDSKVEDAESQAAGADAEDPEEEIEGLNFYTLKNVYPDHNAKLDELRAHLLESSNEMAPLKVWQVQELSLQAAERILAAAAAESGVEALRLMTHIAQNFPLQARSLIRTPVRAELKADVAKHRELFSSNLNLAPSDTGIFINGMFHDMEMTSVFTMVTVCRQELKVMERLHAAGLSDTAANALLAVDLSTTSQDYAIDIRDSAVSWVNDIENDAVYRKWSDSLLDLLRPTFPGMLRSVRRNLYNLVLVVDPSAAASKPLLKLAESFYIHRAPVRIGLVLVVENGKGRTGLDSAGVAVINAFNYVSTNTNYSHEPLSLVTDIYASVPDGRDLTPEDVHKKLKEKYPSIDVEDVFGEDSSFDFGRILAEDFKKKSGLRKLPQALLNGNPLPEKLLTADDFEDAVLSEMMTQTPQLQRAVFRGELSDTDNVVDFLMNRPNVMPRLNERVLSENAVHVDLTVGGDSPARRITSEFLTNVKYMTRRSKKPELITHWVVADLDDVRGRELLRNALSQMLSSAGIRVAVIANPLSDKVTQLTELVLTAVATLEPDVATQYISKLLDNEGVLETLDGFKTPPNFNVQGLNHAALLDAVTHGDVAVKTLKLHREFVGAVVRLKPGQRAVVTNGRVFGPLDPDEEFLVDDFGLVDRFSTASYGEKIMEALKKTGSDDGSAELSGDVLMQVVSILTSRSSTRSRFTVPVSADVEPTPLNQVTLPPRYPELPFLDVVAVVDPVSRGAQKVGPILTVLHQALNARVRVFLNCVDKSSDFPLKSFYKFVLEPEVRFNADGSPADGPIAQFTNLPPTVLLTQAMHVPENWLVESVRSPHDLDNIKLEDILHHNVYSEFELEYLLLEGHCFETNLGNPPRGLQITLGTETNPTMYDTIVMANLGYFQLKANPGAWQLRLRQGRSSEIYNIVSVEGSVTPENSTDIIVVISSLTSHVLKLKVQKKPDKANLDLLSEDQDSQSGIWNSITTTFGSKQEEEPDDVINIFSLASGHLYERFIKIMMLSVLKNTKTPVKFWFLKNYLSPTLKDFLPHMAEEYNFEYELVQYKWPRWLHQQNEKQRIIWGYKILFLDVLFPLHVKKIIFVDADQVVRADMKELRDLELGGAPYGYTPFCNSRREMDGFRFWNQGYWKNHLQGRRYHISALYVVDLRRFRRIAAGDRLRGQYQALSQDPNSLSNLDQDLPNNMIHQVAIKSLPQEWLWCETWCDEASKKYAKTIDLCNNPLTKEAKLTAAMRIVAEWKDYDNEIKQLQRKLDSSAPVEDSAHIPLPPQQHEKHTEL